MVFVGPGLSKTTKNPHLALGFEYRKARDHDADAELVLILCVMCVKCTKAS